MLDEAHGFGVLGENGMGLAEQENLQHRVTFQMGTLSKAAGLSGGYLAASRDWIDLLTNRARSFIYSTAPPPALAHAAIASLDLIRSAEGKSLRAKLQENIALPLTSIHPHHPQSAGHERSRARRRLGSGGSWISRARHPLPHRPEGHGAPADQPVRRHSPEAIASLVSALADS